MFVNRNFDEILAYMSTDNIFVEILLFEWHETVC
jgi:hypothetical protein